MAVALVASVLGAAGAAVAAESDDETFGRLASCFSEREQLLVLALMDESGSLQRTDPDARRVLALESALANLAGLRELAGEGAEIQVGLAAFGAEFRQTHEWTSLNPDTVQDLRARAESFADRDDGLDTDFATALDGAHSVLAQRSAELTSDGGQPPCRVLLLFTDGAYDVEPRSSGVTKWYAPDLPLDVAGNDERVEEAGKERICQDGGLADTLRETDVPLITIAFTSEIAAEDQTFIRAMSSGQADGTTCGSIQRDDVGTFLPAADLSDLLFAFDRATGRILTGQPLEGDEEVEVCAETACPEGTREFELDGSLRQAHLLANLVAPGIEMLLRGPNASQPVRIEAGETQTFEHSGARLTVTPLSRTDIVLDAELPPDDDRWVGTWAVTFIDTTGQNPGAVARSQIILFGALEPEVVGDPVFRLGEESVASVRVVDQAGTPRTPREFVAETQISATITNPIDGSQQQASVAGPGDDGNWSITYTPPEALDATAVNLSVTLDVKTASGVTLQPRTATVSIPVLPPATYPSISPEQLRLATLVGAGEVSETLTITGPESNSGCVWFSPGPLDTPRYAGDVTLTVAPDATSEGTCVEVGADETKQVSVSYSATEVANGEVRAPLTVHLRSDASPDVVERRIPISFDMVSPVNQVKRLGLFLAILLPGLLLPFVLMYVINWWGARFRSPGSTRHCRIPVRVSPSNDLERLDAKGSRSRFELGPRDFSPTSGPSEDVRSFSSAGLQMESHTPLNPFREPYGTVSSNGAAVVASGGASPGAGRAADHIGFELPSSWAFVIHEVTDASTADDADDSFEVRGELHAWLDEAPFAGQGDQLTQRLNALVPDSVQSAARPLHEQRWVPEPATPPVDEGGYQPPGGGRSDTPGSRYVPPTSGTTASASDADTTSGGTRSSSQPDTGDESESTPSRYQPPPSADPDPVDPQDEDGSASPWKPPRP